VGFGVTVGASRETGIDTDMRVALNVAAVDIGTRKRGHGMDSTATGGVTDGRKRADSLSRNRVHEGFAVGSVNETSVGPVGTRGLARNSIAAWPDQLIADCVWVGISRSGSQKEIAGGIGDVIDMADLVAGGTFEADKRSGHKTFGNNIKLLGMNVPIGTAVSQSSCHEIVVLQPSGTVLFKRCLGSNRIVSQEGLQNE